MKRLFLPFLLFLLPLFIFSQEEEPIYTDTVDIVDFLEDAYLDGGKYKLGSGYSLRKVVVTSGFEILNDSIFAKWKNKYIESKEEKFSDSALIQVSSGIWERLNKRLLLKGEKIVFEDKIEIRNCYFNTPGFFFDRELRYALVSDLVKFENFEFNRFYFSENTSDVGIVFDNCYFNKTGYSWFKNNVGLFLSNCEFEDGWRYYSSNILEMDNCIINNGCELRNLKNIKISNCSFQLNSCDTLIFDSTDNIVYEKPGGYEKIADVDSSKMDNLRSANRVVGNPLKINYDEDKSEKTESILIENSSFSSSCEENWILIRTETNYLEVLNNKIPMRLNFQNTKIENSFSFLNNSDIRGVSINNLLFSELKNYVDWNSIKGYKLEFKDENDGLYSEHLYQYYSPIDTQVLYNEAKYNKAIEMYKFLYDNYKTQGNTLSANGCYAEMKQVETQRWKYLYHEDKSFESFFRWQLNSFLSYFTDYGTNPAKAVVKSGWVIFLFAIFYLFFPSDWDVSNRSQLLAKMKDLVNKNREKSFGNTLAFVSYSMFIHALNAITLSLNAFTTLGFGDIPTRGAARYVTIVQGFIGWFLLTIFSVSLINQVLG